MHYCLFSSLNLAEAQHWQTTVQINAADNMFVYQRLHVYVHRTR